MSELLSREKEFVKLNQELDKLTTTALDQQQQPQCGSNSQSSASSSAQAKAELRFLTYTKNKGLNSMLRKSGAGDSGVADSVDSANGTLKDRTNLSSVRPIQGQVRQGKAPPQKQSRAFTPNLTEEETVGTTNRTPTPELQKESTHYANTGKSLMPPYHRKHTKSPDSSTLNSRMSNLRAPTNTSTFTVKYRNPKFVESPSLEVLVKEESSSIKQRLANTPSPGSQMGGSDVDSVIMSSSVGGSTTRRSQGGSTMRKQVSTDGLIKFLKSKIAILEVENDRMSQDMNQQNELLEKTLERQKKVEEQRDQAFAKNNALSEQLSKNESLLDESNRRIKDHTIEHSTHMKEHEQMKREMKVITQTNTNLEKRLYRANEDLENVRNALTAMKNSERELRETLRIESDSKDKQIKSLKKQRADLLNAYKKQLFLIDNLKRQNMCMEQSKMIGFGEKEFTKVLEWNAKE